MNKYSTFLVGAALLATAALASGTVAAAPTHGDNVVFRQASDVVAQIAPASEAITISNYVADQVTIITSDGAACASPTAVFAGSPLDVFVFAVLDGTPLGGAADTKVDV